VFPHLVALVGHGIAHGKVFVSLSAPSYSKQKIRLKKGGSKRKHMIRERREILREGGRERDRKDEKTV
jgi:hypothetical protein